MSVIENSIEVYKNMAKARTQDCINYKKELERYKNIIDELERWLENNIEYGDDDYYDMKAAGVETALNKLKELKGE